MIWGYILVWSRFKTLIRLQIKIHFLELWLYYWMYSEKAQHLCTINLLVHKYLFRYRKDVALHWVAKVLQMRSLLLINLQ